MSKKQTKKPKARGGKAENPDQRFVIDNMSMLLSMIINRVPISKCTSIATGRGIYAKMPDDMQCIRIPMDDYVFMLRRSEDSFVLMSYTKMYFKEATDFLLAESGMKAAFGGTKCRSLSSAMKKDLGKMDEEYADGSIFTSPPACGKMESCKAFRPYRDIPDIRDGVVLVNVGGVGEHQVFRVSGAACTDPDYRIPEIYWLCPLFGAEFKRTSKKNGKEIENSVYRMFDDLFFELFVLESTEWVQASGVEDAAPDGESDVAVATEQEGERGFDYVEGDRIKVILNEEAEQEEEDDDGGRIVFTGEQVRGMDPMLCRAVSDVPVGGWLPLPKGNRPEFLASMDDMVASMVGDIVVSISSMFTGDETIFVFSEMTRELAKRRCAVFHEKDYANWSLCRIRMKRVADMVSGTIK